MSLGTIITTAAMKYGLSPALIAAVIHVESSGCQWAGRYEQAFYSQYIHPRPFEMLPGHRPTRVTNATEKRWRATSWGCMQIMGETARENGYEREHLSELCDPAINIELGARILRKFIDNTDTLDKALLRWNGGGDKGYPGRVQLALDNGDYQYLLG